VSRGAPPGAEPSAPPASRTFAPLRHRDFRRLWLGTFFATAAQWIQQATLGWVVYAVTGSAALLGAVLGVRAIPMLLLAPVSGVVADRFDRRRALAASHVLMFAISVALAALLAWERVAVWHLFAFSVLSGVAAVFDRTLRGTLVFTSVPREEAANAVALNSIAFSVTRALGPGVAGFLIASVGAAWNFGIQSVLYLAVAASALTVSAPRVAAAATRRGSAFDDMKEGLRFAASNPIARVMFVLGLVPPVLLIPSFSALMPVFAVDVFDSGPEVLGLLLSAVGVGGIVGGIAATAATRFDRVGLAQTVALIIFAGSLVCFALSPSVALAVAFLVVAGVAEMVHHTIHVTTLQMCAPEHMRGRVASLLPVFPAFISVGALFAGLAADLLTAPLVVVILALGAMAVAGGAWARSQALRGATLSNLVAAGAARR
jgi:MFS transporter, DHA1 family, staphyloferrin A biosynthesis exporter